MTVQHTVVYLQLFRVYNARKKLLSINKIRLRYFFCPGFILDHMPDRLDQRWYITWFNQMTMYTILDIVRNDPNRSRNHW